MAKKKVQIHGLDKVMESVPEEQRGTLAAEIAEELGDFDACSSAAIGPGGNATAAVASQAAARA